MLVTGPHGASVSSDYPAGLTGAAILRRDLDSELLDAAIAAGVEFMPGVRVHGALAGKSGLSVAGVRIGRRQEAMRSRVTVAADGRRSTTAFALGLTRFPASPRRWAFGTYFSDVDGVGPRGEMHVRTDGYIGVAGLAGGLTNVCVVREMTRAGSDRTPPGEVISRALVRDRQLRDRFARARQVSPVVSLGPLAVEARAAGCPGLLLAGDAAGFVDPMTGDGLRFAFRGGELAAEAALFELETGRPACQRLADARQREFSAKWRVNRAIRALVASPRSVQLAAALSAWWPTPVRYLIGVAGDISLARS
jgi:flavin-dependent dehydrogenase